MQTLVFYFISLVMGRTLGHQAVNKGLKAVSLVSLLTESVTVTCDWHRLRDIDIEYFTLPSLSVSTPTFLYFYWFRDVQLFKLL